jgi:hypothetical protein
MSKSNKKPSPPPGVARQLDPGAIQSRRCSPSAVHPNKNASLQMRKMAAAPPAYRPQPLPKVLQRKVAGRPISAVYRPAPRKIVQPKIAVSEVARPELKTPLVCCPQAMPRVLQMKQALSKNPSVGQNNPVMRLPLARGAVQRQLKNDGHQRPPVNVSNLLGRNQKHFAVGRSIQRAEAAPTRPRRDSANYAFAYSGPSDAEKLTSFRTLAVARIKELKASATVQPYRNTKKENRAELSRAYLCIRMNGDVLASGTSGGNQHGEVDALDSARWDSNSQGNQYYFVCDDGKESCFLCTAIAGLLKIAVAATDNCLYPNYVSPACLQTEDGLWQSFIGDEAYELWQGFSSERKSKLRSNLGWVSEMGLYWQ